MRVHDHDIIQRRLHHSNASTSKTMKTNNSHKHLRRLKDKSSQHNLLTVRPPVRNDYVQLNNSRRPFPQTVNVGKAARELVLRNLVPSHSLRPQTRQQANIELLGEGACAKTTSCTQCSNTRVANFCPSTISYHIITYHITSHHIISYRILLHNTISYHIIS